MNLIEALTIVKFSGSRASSTADPRRILRPLEANAPLAVDPDRILALAVPVQGLQPVGLRPPQIDQKKPARPPLNLR